MDMIDILGDVARFLFRGLAIVAPLLLWQWVVLLGRPPRGVFGMSDATVISGAMLGSAALPLLIPGMALTWDAITGPDGVWDLTMSEFQHRALRYELRAVPALLRETLWGEMRTELRVWIGLALVIWALRIGIGLSMRRGRHAATFLVAEAATFLVSLYGIVYLAPLMLWGVNQMNFWALLVLILLIQDFRHNDPPIVPRLISALSGIARFNRQPMSAVRVVD